MFRRERVEGHPFQAALAGNLNFYLSAVDDRFRHPTGGPTIGFILCKSKKRVLVEHALRDLTKPIGVAEWRTKLVEALPEDLRGSLSLVEERESELGEASEPE